MTTLTITAPVVKRCPYADEIDHGTVTLVFTVPNGEDGPELHDCAKRLAGFAGSKISHEDFTRALACLPDVIEVVTHWKTAGLDVECRVRP